LAKVRTLHCVLPPPGRVLQGRVQNFLRQFWRQYAPLAFPAPDTGDRADAVLGKSGAERQHGRAREVHLLGGVLIGQARGLAIFRSIMETIGVPH
jgi:hypothetical protein